MNISNLQDSGNPKIGAIFTPLLWSRFAVNRYKLFEKWIGGASILDPTAGRGDLIFGLIEEGIKRGFSVENLPIHNLYGVEINKTFFNAIFLRARDRYGINLSRKNYSNGDIFFGKKEFICDILFANPPWQNFVDLPEKYKSKIKKKFFDYDLIANAKDLLLGGSRIDISALVLQKTIEKNLKPDGEAVFFIPLSLLLNDGANRFFRKYRVNGTDYCIDSIQDFNDLKVFTGVATRYGMIHIVRNKPQKFPVDFLRWEGGKWKRLTAKPVFNNDDPLSVSVKTGTNKSIGLKKIIVQKSSQPRQGVNTCGANNIFFFDSLTSIDKVNCRVKNKIITATLPKKYLYPLIVGSNFKEEKPTPKKWVLLPYEHNGKPLIPVQLERDKRLSSYLNKHTGGLKKRKGLLINTWIKKGIWWALLGVGRYNFSSYKIVWEAYGRNTFAPKIFSGKWQANQSLQAFMPVGDKKTALSIYHLLLNSRIEKYLLSLKMEGTMNWAQPGKIIKLLQFENDEQ